MIDDHEIIDVSCRLTLDEAKIIAAAVAQRQYVIRAGWKALIGYPTMGTNFDGSPPFHTIRLDFANGSSANEAATQECIDIIDKYFPEQERGDASLQ
jgi:hypothetical protein